MRNKSMLNLFIYLFKQTVNIKCPIIVTMLFAVARCLTTPEARACWAQAP